METNIGNLSLYKTNIYFKLGDRLFVPEDTFYVEKVDYYWTSGDGGGHVDYQIYDMLKNKIGTLNGPIGDEFTLIKKIV